MGKKIKLFGTAILFLGLTFLQLSAPISSAHAENKNTAFNGERLWWGYYDDSGYGYLFTQDGDEFQVKAKNSVVIDVWSKGYQWNKLYWAETEKSGNASFSVTYNGKQLAAPGYSSSTLLSSIDVSKRGKYTITISPSNGASNSVTILTFKDSIGNTYKVKMTRTKPATTTSTGSSSSSSSKPSTSSSSTGSTSSSSSSTSQPSTSSSSSSTAKYPTYTYPSYNYSSSYTSSNSSSSSSTPNYNTSATSPYNTIAGIEFDPTKLTPEYVENLLKSGKCYPVETQAGYFIPRIEDQMLCLRAVLSNIGSGQYLTFNVNYNPHQPITKSMFDEMLSAGIKNIGVTTSDTLNEARYSLSLDLSRNFDDFYPYVEWGTNDIFDKYFTSGDDVWFRFVDQHTTLPHGLTIYLPIPLEVAQIGEYEIFYYDHENDKLVKIAEAENTYDLISFSLDKTPSDVTDFTYIVKPSGSYVAEETIDAQEVEEELSQLETTSPTISPVIIIVIAISVVLGTTGCTAIGVMIWQKLHHQTGN